MTFTGDRLDLLDQRGLPHHVRWVECRSALEVAEAIKGMVVRGAPAIGVAAAYGVALEALRCQSMSLADFTRAVQTGVNVLAASRPTAVNLFWALNRMGRLLTANSRRRTPGELASDLAREAISMQVQDVEANKRMGEFGAALLPDRVRVLTHCNAGALATAGYGTALGVIRSAVQAGKKISVIADETRPLLQGARLTAWELQQERIPLTVITDSMSGYMMANKEVDVVIVGADRVAANGDTVNKIGTYGLAVLAYRHGIPFYVACPLSTIDLSMSDGTEIPIEERSSDEVVGFGSERWAPIGVEVRNPAFDVTPAGLITALITDRGVIHNPGSISIRTMTAIWSSTVHVE
jgi:methylthioribose-1-phosphate isomerase